MWGRIVAIGLMAGALGGCQTLPSQPNFSSYLVLPKTTDSTGKPTYTAAQFRSYIVQGEPISCTSLPNPVTKPLRDACIVDLMTDIDAAYYNYEISVNNAISRLNAALDIAQNAFSISGTAAGGTASKALNSMATFTGDAKTAISDELLYKTSIQILISTMEADRAKQAAQIRLSMQSDVDSYTMAQARQDLLAYFYAGTAAHALAEANNNAAAVAQKCQAADKAVKAAVAGAATPVASGATALTASANGTPAAATTTSDQCNQIADSVRFKFDASATTASLLNFLAPQGVYSSKAAGALSTCVKSTTQPAGFHLSDYTLPNGSYDLGSLIADGGVDGKYKAQLLTCAKAEIAKNSSESTTTPPNPVNPNNPTKPAHASDTPSAAGA